MNLCKNHFHRRNFDLECGDTSPLWNEATCRLVGKRGRARAVQRPRGIRRGNFYNI